MDSATLTAARWWQHLLQVQQQARVSGALVPLTTRSETLWDGALRFAVRVLLSPVTKPSSPVTKSAALATKSAPPSTNPFLPYEPALYVSDLLEQHVCLLNKYSVTDHHLLVVTKEYRSQDEPLQAMDFAALDWCFVAAQQLGWHALAFFNGGRVAGASQPHKHLQLLLWSPADPPLPLWDWLAADPGAWDRGGLQALPFEHQLVRYADRSAMAAYVSLRAQRNAAPYNLLWTRDWMLHVPRRAECFGNISLNSLAFAGGLFVRSESQWQALQEAGPLAALQATTFSDKLR
ncbi:MAG: phosphorylase [Planctomycetota bacterium]